METWATGWLIAVGIGLWRLGALVVNACSVRTANLKLIGGHFSPWTGLYNASAPASLTIYSFFAAYVLLVAPLFSWLSVGMFALTLVNNWRKQAALPEKLKELSYRLNHVRMTEEQVRALDAEFKSFHAGRPISPTPELVKLDVVTDWHKDGNRLELSLESGEWFEDFMIDRDTKDFTWTAGHSDHSGDNESTGKYRVDPDGRVYLKTLDDHVDRYGEVSHRIRYGVVCEAELRAEAKKRTFLLTDVEDDIAAYRRSI